MKTLSTQHTHRFLLVLLILIIPDIACAASLNLKWNPNSESDLSYYSVYCGSASRSYGNPIPVGKATAYAVEGLAAGRKYYCAVTATDTSGNESGFSSEVSRTTPDENQPSQEVSGTTPDLNQPSLQIGANKLVDFNGDGQTDILWHHKAAGSSVAWHMNGTNQVGYSWLPKLNDMRWKLAGVGDFNRDGLTDILWRHKKSGGMVAWHMDGAKQIGHSWLPTLADNSWEVAGIGDFNKDGSMDILWHNSVSGENAIWHMEGAKRIDVKVLRTVPDTDWKIGGLGDFNQDGSLDIMWHHFKSGGSVVWYMSDANQIGYNWLPKRTGQNWWDWEVTGVDDFDNDGSADILWRNFKTGENSIWLMNKTAKKSTQNLRLVADTRWESNL